MLHGGRLGDETSAPDGGGQKQNHLDLLPYGCDGWMSTFIHIFPPVMEAYWAAIQRGRLVGAFKPEPPPRDDDPEAAAAGREALPAGHPASWGAITAGSTTLGWRGAWLEQAPSSATRESTATRAIIDIVRTSCLKPPDPEPEIGENLD